GTGAGDRTGAGAPSRGTLGELHPSVPCEILSLKHRAPALDRLDLVHLDDVAVLDVVVPLDADTALVPGSDLTHVVFEAAEARHLAFVDDPVVAEKPYERASLNGAVENVGSGNNSETRHFEGLSHLDPAESRLLQLRLFHSKEELLHGVDQLVNDPRVE